MSLSSSPSESPDEELSNPLERIQKLLGERNNQKIESSRGLVNINRLPPFTSVLVTGSDGTDTEFKLFPSGRIVERAEKREGLGLVTKRVSVPVPFTLDELLRELESK